MTKKIISMPTGFNPSEWSRKTNCYMYAINYQKDNNPRDVGELSGNLIKDYYTVDEIKERLFEDMKMLNMEIKKATYEEECLENEWKIALFYREEDGDFHFLREDYHNRWSHKTKGRKPSNKDYSNATIIDRSLKNSCNVMLKPSQICNIVSILKFLVSFFKKSEIVGKDTPADFDKSKSFKLFSFNKL